MGGGNSKEQLLGGNTSPDKFTFITNQTQQGSLFLGENDAWKQKCYIVQENESLDYYLVQEISIKNNQLYVKYFSTISDYHAEMKGLQLKSSLVLQPEKFFDGKADFVGMPENQKSQENKTFILYRISSPKIVLLSEAKAKNYPIRLSQVYQLALQVTWNFVFNEMHQMYPNVDPKSIFLCLDEKDHLSQICSIPNFVCGAKLQVKCEQSFQQQFSLFKTIIAEIAQIYAKGKPLPAKIPVDWGKIGASVEEAKKFGFIAPGELMPIVGPLFDQSSFRTMRAYLAHLIRVEPYALFYEQLGRDESDELLSTSKLISQIYQDLASLSALFTETRSEGLEGRHEIYLLDNLRQTEKCVMTSDPSISKNEARTVVNQIVKDEDLPFGKVYKKALELYNA